MAAEQNKQMKHGAVYTCKKYRLYAHLCKNKFKPFKVIISPLNPNHYWWQFKNSVELEEVITKYYENLNKLKKED